MNQQTDNTKPTPLLVVNCSSTYEPRNIFSFLLFSFKNLSRTKAELYNDYIIIENSNEHIKIFYDEIISVSLSEEAPLNRTMLNLDHIKWNCLILNYKDTYDKECKLFADSYYNNFLKVKDLIESKLASS